MLKDGLLFEFVNGQEVLVVPRKMHHEIIKSINEKGHYAAKMTE